AAALSLAEEAIASGVDISTVVDGENFINIVKMQEGLTALNEKMISSIRGEFGLLNTRFAEIPDVLPEGGYATPEQIAYVLRIFTVTADEEITSAYVEQLIRYYNEAIALMRIYLEQASKGEYKIFSHKLNSALIAPRVRLESSSGTKSHPAGNQGGSKSWLTEEGVEELIRRVTESSNDMEIPFTSRDADELRNYYIPLAVDIIERQEVMGKRYVVAIAGPGGIGKSTFALRFQRVIEAMLGKGEVGLMKQDEFFFDLEPDISGNPYSPLTVVGVKEQLRARGDIIIPNSRASGRFLDVPMMLEQINAVRESGRGIQPIIERTVDIRRRIGLSEIKANRILLVEGHYMIVNDLYDSKFAPDAEWSAFYRQLYATFDLRLFFDAELDLIKEWKINRPSERRGRSDEVMEQRWEERYKEQAVKAKVDVQNADVIVEKGRDHRIVNIRSAHSVSGTKSHPTAKSPISDNLGAEEATRHLARAIINATQDIQSPFTSRDLNDLCEYYIPLVAEILLRQAELGRRYVVAISGPGGIGKSIFSERLKFIIDFMVGDGQVGLMRQDEFFYDLERYEDGNPYSDTTVATIRQQLISRGDKKIPASDGSGRFLDVPFMLEQLRAFDETGKCVQPIIRREKIQKDGREVNFRERIGLSEITASKILLVEGLYLLVNDLYGTKFAPDAEWGEYFRQLYAEFDLHLFLDAELDLIKEWKINRPSERRGRSDEVMERRWQERYKLHAVKSEEDIDNADIIIEKGPRHEIKKIVWDEAYDHERILESFGVELLEAEESDGLDLLKLLEADRLQDERGHGRFSLVLLFGGEQGGLNPLIEEEVYSLLTDDFEIFKLDIHSLSESAILTIFNDLIKQIMVNEEYSLPVSDLNKLDVMWSFSNANGGLEDHLKDYLVKIQVSPRAKRLQELLRYCGQDSRVLVLRRKNSRSAVMAHRRISIELAQKLLDGRNPFTVDEQDFVRQIVVGSQDNTLVMPGMLRYISKRESRRTDGVLYVIEFQPVEGGIHAANVHDLAVEIASYFPEDTKRIIDYIKRYVA
ncbi:MAG: hypothetical protein PHO70_08605, partial [Candidatus Omnitrophica bacterium]|nr:hypothetical protein [Candidatus Omnitrophota bacterium]